eukprot:TRINITY_DN24464_c0_g1_i1.p1 TRINITY_DN24464_c0_g1~~TRINITY_DN24464_c0_g1_i1.p1  ORF type:complete len:164 (+),score=24.29 TRINITY_DN24464_c0_g1_i1:42-494(+)
MCIRDRSYGPGGQSSQFGAGQAVPFIPDSSTQAFITRLQIDTLIQGLEAMYPDHSVFRAKLKNAKDLNIAGDFNLAAEILNEIFYRKDVNPEEKPKFDKILNDGITIGRNSLNHYAQQKYGQRISANLSSRAYQGPRDTGSSNQPYKPPM